MTDNAFDIARVCPVQKNLPWKVSWHNEPKHPLMDHCSTLWDPSNVDNIDLVGRPRIILRIFLWIRSRSSF